jgi:hypothetical protein
VFDNRELRRIYESERGEVAGVWRKLLYKKLHKLYTPLNIMNKSMRIKCTEHTVRIGEVRNAYKVLIGTPEGKRPFGRPRRRGRIILKWIFIK